ncbi:PIG-L family deacetylase [Micromonospora sp. LH3U1]|uniref:PIG-L family deacetylase n=1 Tax=Micromonospora sp. LH3U1 TaxID=3018339 RepID=UPI00234A5C2B|nr:PIG-L family deacetylase [Micromonospora sp. LH3U1]WCN83026.1 PIG-L family deacetylase [Micromonospora sp. LH3U1]
MTADRRHLTGRPRSMAVVAHQDDDLYFLNPLLVSQLRHSQTHLTVCLTAGEADGRNAPAGSVAHAALPVDFEGFAAARFNGLRSAYGEMVLGDRDAKWRREAVTVGSAIEADLSTLVDAPRIRLVSLNLWCAPPPGSPVGAGPLPRLWTGEATVTPTMVPLGSPVSGTFGYSRESMIEALLHLLRDVEPTLLWTMDPDPDRQPHNKENPQHADTGEYSDHIFHTVTGLFTQEAARRWFAEGGGRATTVEAFRGYYVRRWPSNLSPEARALKQRYKDVYGWADGRPADSPVGRGDRKVGGDAIGAGNASGTTLRYPGSRAWAVPSANGRLSAFAVRGGQVIQWQQAGSGAFAPGRVVPGTGLLPHVAALAAPNGGWRLFAVWQGLTAEPDQHIRDIRTIVLPAAGEYADVRWESLGNPNGRSAPVKRRNTGMPQAVALPGGGILLLARNSGKGLSGRLYDGTSWTPWQDLGGRETQDGLTVVALDDHTVEVLAAGRTGTARWQVSVPELTAEYTLLETEPPAGPPAVVRLPDGDRLLLFRRRNSASVLSYRSRSAGRGWDLSTAVDLGGHGGPGPLTARFVPGEGAILVAVRDDESGSSVTWLDPAGPTPCRWLRESTPIVGGHALQVDEGGRPVVLAVSTAGGLLASRPDRNGSPLYSMKEVP